jgi:hypothetical protein
MPTIPKTRGRGGGVEVEGAQKIKLLIVAEIVFQRRDCEKYSREKYLTIIESWWWSRFRIYSYYIDGEESDFFFFCLARTRDTVFVPPPSSFCAWEILSFASV